MHFISHAAQTCRIFSVITGWFRSHNVDEHPLTSVSVDTQHVDQTGTPHSGVFRLFSTSVDSQEEEKVEKHIYEFYKLKKTPVSDFE